jgi:hypothetical protein
LSELFEQIKALMGAPARDLEKIERTLTDGYAHALSLEAERWRIQKRLAAVVQGLEHGDTSKKAQELSALAKGLDGNAEDLSHLRGMLTELRRHADVVRVGSPVA